MRLCLIAAVAENGVVGNNNALPWHLPGELAYFKRQTLGKPIVMGRKTFESIGRPLPGRTNIVVSRNKSYAPEGVEVVDSLESSLTLAAGIARTDGQEDLMVIGGAAIYAAALPLAERLYITEVHAEVEGDAYFPEVDWRQWREVSRQRNAAPESDGYDFSFVVFQRRD
ncbi:MAG: dihydrofolate reductase [Halioglobus sp.]